MVREDLTPDRILTREAFENAIMVNSAIGGSTNCVPHLVAIARHVGVPLETPDWESVGHGIPLLANIQPAGEFLGEAYYRAGGVPAIIGELNRAGKINGDAMTVTGRTIGENCKGAGTLDAKVIRRVRRPADGERRLPGCFGESVRIRHREDLRHQQGVQGAVS